MMLLNVMITDAGPARLQYHIFTTRWSHEPFVCVYGPKTLLKRGLFLSAEVQGSHQETFLTAEPVAPPVGLSHHGTHNRSAEQEV